MGTEGRGEPDQPLFKTLLKGLLQKVEIAGYG